MQVRRARGGILAALLGLAVLPAALPLGLPVGRQAADVVVDIPGAAGTLLVVRHAGTAPVTVDTTVLTGPAVRGWWVDGTTGQNGLEQAKEFADSVDISDVLIAKLDGTAKGGIAFSVAQDRGIDPAPALRSLKGMQV